MKKSPPFHLQHDQSDCGVACLANIIRYHGGDANLETLRKLSGTSRQGTTLLGLLQAAQQLDFDAEGLEAEGLHNLNELTEPAILHVVMEEKLQHYVVYYPSENWKNISGKITIGDPAKGIQLIDVQELDKIWKSKALLSLNPTAQFHTKEVVVHQKRKWILDLLRDDFSVLGISLALGIIITALGISTAIFSQKLIDDILPKENMQKLLLSICLVTVLLLARSGLNYLRGFFMLHQGMAFNNRVIQDFFGNILKLPKSFFDTRKIGELIARMSDTRRIQSVIATLTGSAVIDFLLVVVSIGFVTIYSWWIGCVLLVCVFAYTLILLKFSKPISQSQKEVMAGYALTESNFIDSMQGVTEIKLMNKENLFEKLNQSVYEKFQDRIFSLGTLNLRFSLITEITGVIFIMTVFGLASFQVLSKKLSIGELVALLGMAGNIIPSLTRLVVANIQIQEAKVVFDRMFEFTSMEKESNSTEAIIEATNLHLKIDSVSFRFPGRKQILSDVSLEVMTGNMMALLGESGGGKSTLLQLIQKFYPAENGSISVNGVALHDISTDDWRSHLGCVSQDVKIFNNNLLFNITLSDDIEINNAAIAFCEKNGFGYYFNQLPQSYLTLVGEEGVNLSGGQKQLVAVARALFRNPKLLLLDEATSAMDRKTEHFVIQLLNSFKERMAILFITHRIKTASHCDRIYVLENGKIVLDGEPAELSKSGKFNHEEIVN